ncbi:MGMT family protein [Wukongibacter sp. M2B1]|uniref:MGMT family protein n=1 Tax=Wukongibacter sp. M2B1 TaxID=3088895 RepID=UPI003D7B4EC1
MTEFTSKLLEIITNIPYGKVTTYGRVAEIAGNPRAARQVSWTLRAYSNKYNLPWHRIINSKGTISLKRGQGFELQKSLLEEEGILVMENGRVDLREYLWNGDSHQKFE